MAKKAKPKTKAAVSKKKSQPGVGDVPGIKQTAGAMTGAVLGGVVGGPVGALAAGALGAMVGDSSAKGKRPIGRAVDVIREEITSGRAKERIKSVSESIGKRFKSLRSGGHQDAPAKQVVAKKTEAKPAGKKKKKKAAATTGPTKTSPKKAKQAVKGASATRKKVAKKKR